MAAWVDLDWGEADWDDREDNWKNKTAVLLQPAKERSRGWGSTGRGGVFAELIEAVRPKVIVKLGAFLGASPLHMAAVSRNLSLSPAILCIDDFRGWPAFRERFQRDVPPPWHGDALLLRSSWPTWPRRALTPRRPCCLDRQGALLDAERISFGLILVLPLDSMEKLSITVLIDDLLFHLLQRQGTLLDSRGAVASSEFRTDYSVVLLNSDP
ncbi:uncharacterized protein C2845_PM11G28840 [Panicum miliaceum]|uniref:Uncharacterized protein n=1 Tax=Panicum miliaceum TaxID=4540 RepID=A0A3L6RMN5_PANMI|nr:uncharacterized protein C2845_PM11G28840 [Panicum miliaceum]